MNDATEADREAFFQQNAGRLHLLTTIVGVVRHGTDYAVIEHAAFEHEEGVDYILVDEGSAPSLRGAAVKFAIGFTLLILVCREINGLATGRWKHNLS